VGKAQICGGRVIAPGVNLSGEHLPLPNVKPRLLMTVLCEAAEHGVYI